MTLTIIDAFLITFTPYIIMIFYHIKIIKYFKRHRHTLSTVSRKVQTDLNRILMTQAIIPIFSAFLPMSIHLLSAVTDLDLVFETFIGGILYSWIPTGNAISVLFFVTAYRRKLKQIICHKDLKLPRFFSVANTVTAQA